MPNTNVQARLHEIGLNVLVRSLRWSRPFLFNYGTRYFRDDLDRFCEKIPPSPSWVPAGLARMTVQPPILVPGTAGQVALDFCFQVVGLTVDFHPSSVFDLPPELHLAPQGMALSAQIAGTIVCPETAAVNDFGDTIAHPPPQSDDEREEDEEPPGPTLLPPGDLHCFSLKVYATAEVGRKNYEKEADDGTLETHEELGFTLRGFEIEDVSPNGLENNVECLVSTIVRLAVLPRLRLSLDAIVFALGTHLDATITMPDDPLVQNDQLIVSVLVDVS